MSLISDALKRQEQLRAPRTGAAQREVSAASPPEVAVARPPDVSAARPPEASRGSAAPNLAAPAAQPRRASGATSRGEAAPNLAAPAAQPRAALPPHNPSNRQTVKPSNPFLERERAAARRPNHTVLLMPVIGLLMLLVLIFLRREFVPLQPSQAVTVKKVESEKWEVESSGGPGAVPAATPVDNPAAAVLSDLFPEEAESLGGPGAVPAATSAENPGEPGAVPAATPVDIPKAEPSIATETNQLPTSNSLNVSAVSAPLRETPPPAEPSNGQTVKPSNQAAETSPQQPAWPVFTLTGIAVGRERIAVLSTGEMLLAGETSKCGVKVQKVNAATVVFAWGGETKTLRKGEHSDKPAD